MGIEIEMMVIEKTCFSRVFFEDIEKNFKGSYTKKTNNIGYDVTLYFDGREIITSCISDNIPDFQRILYKMVYVSQVGVLTSYQNLCDVNNTIEIDDRCIEVKNKLHYLLGDEVFQKVIKCKLNLDKYEK
jgi:hypothetical protein